MVHPSKGDLLFSRANTRDLVGATCIVDKDYLNLFLPDKLWNLKLHENELNKVFVHFLFKNKSFKNTLTREASGTSGSMLNISMEKLRNLKIPVPPIELQTHFAQIVEKTEALKTQYQHSLQGLENLYGSLSQLAFKGELKICDQAG
ncbi:MAG: restriction endonuclease subunit S [Bacteroidales bacterium]|nr:restriction endonuclease subunit S [Bacteroidales bacterium]